MNIAMLDGRYTIVIEAPINNLDALIACDLMIKNGIDSEDIVIQDGFDGDPQNPEYCEVGFTVDSLHSALNDLALANIDADIQILQADEMPNLTVTYNAYIRSGAIHINSKTQDNAAYELAVLKKSLNNQGNHSADESINAQIQSLHPYGWVITGTIASI